MWCRKSLLHAQCGCLAAPRCMCTIVFCIMLFQLLIEALWCLHLMKYSGPTLSVLSLHHFNKWKYSTCLAHHFKDLCGSRLDIFGILADFYDYNLKLNVVWVLRDVRAARRELVKTVQWRRGRAEIKKIKKMKSCSYFPKCDVCTWRYACVKSWNPNIY